MLNDADAAGLGEAVYGSGKKYKNIVMATIGTELEEQLYITAMLFPAAVEMPVK